MTWLERIFGIGIKSQLPLSESEQQLLAIQKVMEANTQVLEEDVAKEEAKEEALVDQLVVIAGAQIKMGAHMGEFSVLQDVPTTQDKPTGTIVEKTIANFSFMDGFQLISILGDWQDFGTYQVQDHAVLLKKSKLQAIGKMPGKKRPETGTIEFVNSGQINSPTVLQTKGAPVPTLKAQKKNICFCGRDLSMEEFKNI